MVALSPYLFSTGQGSPADKGVKIAAETAAEKTRDASLKSLEVLILAEKMRSISRKHIDNNEVAELMKKSQALVADAKAAGEEADLAFKNLQAIINSSAPNQHYAYLQAVERYRLLCTRNIELWMLANKQRDLTDRNDSEAYKKATSACNEIKEFSRESATSGFFVPTEFRISD